MVGLRNIPYRLNAVISVIVLLRISIWITCNRRWIHLFYIVFSKAISRRRISIYWKIDCIWVVEIESIFCLKEYLWKCMRKKKKQQQKCFYWQTLRQPATTMCWCYKRKMRDKKNWLKIHHRNHLKQQNRAFYCCASLLLWLLLGFFSLRFVCVCVCVCVCTHVAFGIDYNNCKSIFCLFSYTLP